jgi:hypothetical protein
MRNHLSAMYEKRKERLDATNWHTDDSIGEAIKQELQTQNHLVKKV